MTSGSQTMEPKLEALAERLGDWFLEDFSPGQTFELGTAQVSEGEIIDFASRYDPQTFHVDPVAAKDSPFGGLIASGWLTVSLVTRLWIDVVVSKAAALGSPGLDGVRFFAPVRPGDVLTCKAEVTAARPSDRRPWRGTMIATVSATNQDGVLAANFIARTLIARRSWVEERLAAA